MEFTRAKMHDQKHYFGEKDAKLIKNFMFDIEQYFLAVRVESEEIMHGYDVSIWRYITLVEDEV